MTDIVNDPTFNGVPNTISSILESLNEVMVSTEDAPERIHLEVCANVKDIYAEVQQLKAFIAYKEEMIEDLCERLGMEIN
tara:strand:- start:363 stop:602 length:240 start_codon:yes stop_codon:yes gene_type:complete